MKFEPKKDFKRLIVVCLASVLMALNIKSFVRTGGLYPGGATGLSLLIQRGAQMYLGLALPYTVINVILNAIPIYVFLSVYCADQCTYRRDSGYCHYF